MNEVTIRRGRPSDSRQFIGLLVALAKFERLKPPSAQGKRRILEDVFENRRINLFVAVRGNKLVGYALYFYTYSSFLAKPTLYLEDLFVLADERGGGVGLSLFKRCVKEAMGMGCGRMEWSVLAWNEKAMRFYEGLGAKKLSEWYVYRLDEKSLSKVARGR